MSVAWETTEDDVTLVLNQHKVVADKATLERAMEALDGEEDRIEDAALHYDDMDDQTTSALDEIEDILIEAGVLTGPKKYQAP